MSEQVNHPSHYGGKDNPYEAIKIIEALSLNFNLGNTLKYVCRAGKKGNKLEDLKKAQFYLNREIENESKKKSEGFATVKELNVEEFVNKFGDIIKATFKNPKLNVPHFTLSHEYAGVDHVLASFLQANRRAERKPYISVEYIRLPYAKYPQWYVVVNTRVLTCTESKTKAAAIEKAKEFAKENKI